MLGRVISHYLILERLDEGGQGVVYRAQDKRLDREVAIKVLPAGALADEGARKKFRKEALTLSKLNHPNIATVFDFDSEGSLDFLVMELVPGQTLSKRITEGAFSGRDIARLGAQMAEGLAAAHEAGVLHCDIKPGNLRVTPTGHLKILDFGLAKLTPLGSGAPGAVATVTASPHLAGTLPYMAPEQLRGEKPDARADLYAAGTVLYEMASGKRAFPHETAGRVISAILSEAPAPLRNRSGQFDPQLERIVLKCLEKEPEDRYQSAADLAVDLRHLGTPPPQPRSTGPASRRKPRGRTRTAAVGAMGLAVAAVILVATGVGGIRDRIFGGSDSGGAPSLAVLPLTNLSGDPGQEYFAEGMTDELITRLAQVSALRVISRSSVMRYKGTKKSLPQIARELGVRMVVEESVLRAGDMVRITAELVLAATGQTIWADGYERQLRNVLGLQSEVAQNIVERVQVKLTPSEKSRLRSAPQVDPRAHEAYLRGLVAGNEFSSTGLRRGIDYFQKAIQIDPNYAPAYVGMANAYTFSTGMYLPASEGVPRARAAALKALELDPNSGAAHGVLGYLKFSYDWDAPGATSEFRQALQLSPGDATVHSNFAVLLISMGKTDQAIAEIGRTRQIDPLSAFFASMSLWPLFEGHRFREAADAARDILNSGSDTQDARMVLGQAQFFLGDHPRGIENIRRASDADSGSAFPLGWLGFAYGMAGQKQEARDVLAKLESIQRKQYVEPYCFAILHVGLGDRDEAFQWLNRAVDEHSDELFFVRVDPALDTLRSDPRFAKLLKRMGLVA